MKKKYIKVSPEIREQLKTEFAKNGKPLQDATVYRILRYTSDSYMAEQLRKRALELGGRVIEEHDVTETEQ